MKEDTRWNPATDDPYSWNRPVEVDIEPLTTPHDLWSYFDEIAPDPESARFAWAEVLASIDVPLPANGPVAALMIVSIPDATHDHLGLGVEDVIAKLSNWAQVWSTGGLRWVTHCEDGPVIRYEFLLMPIEEIDHADGTTTREIVVESSIQICRRESVLCPIDGADLTSQCCCEVLAA
ncbi:DUF2236 domain-containing protein [Salipiger mucosus]|uniref:Uncharacterized protein n=1 Tax=Salipiger mucosus DSM 16094 TaxID=1123237 RepID=S9QA04_9RHOB|nr:DUF2236 domain-containing protein [Salipiger mucosus]EPX76458.1 hypothetical protein Salmuc_00344 [Salipiger mucosus DSM 16094]